MRYRFDPRTFIDQPMHLARSADNDFRVMVASHTAGRLFGTLRSGRRPVWLWTVTGPYLPGAQLNSNGDSADLAEAKAAFRATFDTWLTWAMRQNGDVVWHE